MDSLHTSNHFFSGIKMAKSSKTLILLLGPPSVGKSTQTLRLINMLPNVLCISTGNMLRQLKKKKSDGLLSLTLREQEAVQHLDLMAQGGLMDGSIVFALLMEYLSPAGAGYDEYLKSEVIILDGVIKDFKNISQFESALEAFNASTHNSMTLKQVINLKAPVDELMSRHDTRVEDARKKGIPQRLDDAPENYTKRLNDYMAETADVIQHYESNQILTEIDACQPIDQITSDLINTIQSQMEKMENASRSRYQG